MKSQHMNGMARTFVLMAGMTALFGTIGLMLGGTSGMVMALLFAAGTNMFAYWNSDKMVLKMHNARAVTRSEAPDIYAMTERLVNNAQMPMPTLYIMDNEQPNAFATGRNPEHGVVALTTGLLKRLNKEEIEGVIAHELSHIKNRDSLIMTITATIGGTISTLANMSMFVGSEDRRLGAIGTIVVMIVAPLAASIVQMAISRTREYAADRSGAEMSGNPLALASALEKIQGMAARIDNMPAERSPASAQLFIINPLHKQSIDGLFSTHPNTEKRIAVLQEIAREMGTQHFSTEQSIAAGPWG
jgi:heat shock protein HtpX